MSKRQVLEQYSSRKLLQLHGLPDGTNGLRTVIRRTGNKDLYEQKYRRTAWQEDLCIKINTKKLGKSGKCLKEILELGKEKISRKDEDFNGRK